VLFCFGFGFVHWVFLYFAISTMDLLHLVSLNVQGIRDPVKRFLVAEWMKLHSVDVLCLQETHVTPDSSD
jgi:hypothetical protein